MTVDALKEFMLDNGASIKTVLMEWDRIWATNNKYIDKVATRFNAISDQTKSLLKLQNASDVAEGITVNCHPKVPELGKRVRVVS